MKNLIYFLVFALAVFTFSSCEQAPVITPEPTPTTGSLSFTIECSDGPVADAEIALSTDEPGSQDIVYLATKTTDREGAVTFSELEPGAYYWFIKFKNSQEFVDMGLGSYEIEAGDKMGGPVFIGRNCN
ncbi:MAG: SpaA isopeptide-forming pilin-related protein [Bacteroidia bacterium]